MFGDSPGDELCVVFDPADERGTSRVLPRETEEVQPTNVGDTSPVTRSAAVVEDRQVDPRVIGPIAGRPDHCIDGELVSVLEAHVPPISADQPWSKLNAVTSPELARVRSDQRVAVLHLRAQP